MTVTGNGTTSDTANLEVTQDTIHDTFTESTGLDHGLIRVEKAPVDDGPGTGEKRSNWITAVHDNITPLSYNVNFPVESASDNGKKLYRDVTCLVFPENWEEVDHKNPYQFDLLVSCE